MLQSNVVIDLDRLNTVLEIDALNFRLVDSAETK